MEFPRIHSLQSLKLKARTWKMKFEWWNFPPERCRFFSGLWPFVAIDLRQKKTSCFAALLWAISQKQTKPPKNWQTLWTKKITFYGNPDPINLNHPESTSLIFGLPAVHFFCSCGDQPTLRRLWDSTNHRCWRRRQWHSHAPRCRSRCWVPTFLGGGNSNMFYVHSYLGMMIPNLTSIFFKGVGSTTNQFFMNHYVDFEPFFGRFMKFEHQIW